MATDHRNERHRQLSHTSARDVFMNCPESHLLITALRRCYQEVLQWQDRPQNAAECHHPYLYMGTLRHIQLLSLAWCHPADSGEAELQFPARILSPSL